MQREIYILHTAVKNEQKKSSRCFQIPRRNAPRLSMQFNNETPSICTKRPESHLLLAEAQAIISAIEAAEKSRFVGQIRCLGHMQKQQQPRVGSSFAFNLVEGSLAANKRMSGSGASRLKVKIIKSQVKLSQSTLHIE